MSLLPTLLLTFPALQIPDLLEEGAQVERLATGMEFVEGPVWIPEQKCLVFSDIPARRLMRWSLEDGLAELRIEEHPNGNLLDLEGRLLTCRHGTRDLLRSEPDGGTTVLVDRFGGRRLNSPNDLTLGSHGHLWFTDPPWGLTNQTAGRELGGNFVFHLAPGTGDVRAVLRRHAMPNGIALSPDGRRLYVADTGGHPSHPDPTYHGREATVTAYAIAAPGILERAPLWSVPTRCDGMCVDTEGNLYTTHSEGVRVLSPGGEILGTIEVPETPANVCFGGEEFRTLFITARTSLYSLRMRATGHRPRAGQPTPREIDRRGDEHLLAGRFTRAVADFDQFVAAEPRADAHHWRRGIAYYYADRQDEGVAQFERHRGVNPADVENAAWHFLCVAARDGTEAARKALLPVGRDGRAPMEAVYELYAGRASHQDVLAAAEQDGTPSAYFYGQLYVGLHHEAFGRHELARTHIERAAKTPASSGYMAALAHMHAELLARRATAEDPPLDREAVEVLDVHRGERVRLSKGATWIHRDGVWGRWRGEGPPPRRTPGLAYDPWRGEVLLFGGHDETESLADTWIFDAEGWRQVPGTGPPPEASPALSFDPSSRTTQLLDSAWTWNGQEWASN